MFKKKLEKEITYLVGDRVISNFSTIPFEKKICNFLEELSKNLFKNKEAGEYPDIITFAFWCRKNNIEKLRNRFISPNLRLGLGLIFHITPSNIPTNFAYSLIFGLINGNSNIVKVPSKKFKQVDLICDALNFVLQKKKFKEIKKMIKIVRYSSKDNVTKELSNICDARLIWGGDETINEIRNFKIKERAIDIAFANRFSFSVINSNEILKLSNKGIKNLSTKFYNDTYLVDQNACSSPKFIVWFGKNIKRSREKFWRSLHKEIANKYDMPDIASIDKFNDLCKNIIDNSNFKKQERFGNYIYTISLKSLDYNYDNLKSKWGFFYELETNDLKKISKYINKKFQTLTYFGFKKDFFKKFIVENNIPGIDRVVPIGQALDINFYWDGYDMNSTLTRIIDIK